MVVSLGPTSMSTGSKNVKKNPKSDGTGANPRCLRRDVNRNAAMGATNAKAYSLLQNTEMNKFYDQLLGSPAPKNDPYPWGVCYSFSNPYRKSALLTPSRSIRLAITLPRWTLVETH